MITSPHNEKLKLIRKLHERKHRESSGLFAAEGEDLIEAATAAGVEPRFVLRAGQDVDRGLLDSVSALGSGSRVIGVFEQRFESPGGDLCVYLHGVADPGNVGTIIRSAHALGDGPVVLGPGCADPYSPKAVRASMGSVFARPPARGALEELEGTKVALDAGAALELGELDASQTIVVCLGAEREGIHAIADAVDARARIAMRPGGPDSLNVAMAATLALYELGRRMAGHG